MQPFGVQDEPPETGWTQAVGMAEKIAAWEKETGIKVPPDYRAFMVAVNGGVPWPNLVSVPAVPADIYPTKNQDVVIFFLNNWDSAAASWDDGLSIRPLPPNVIHIADDSSDLLFLLSLDKATWGQVFAWRHTNVPWGTDKNNRTYPVAPSFNDFLRGFHGNDRKPGYGPWDFESVKAYFRAYQIPDEGARP